MPEMTGYANGVPSWVDLSSPDIAASAAFYGGLFGWQFQDAGPDAGGYGMFLLRGKMVAGLGPLQDPNQPPAWSTYVNVDDADTTVKTAREEGATVFVEPMDVMDAGRMAIFADPTGAVAGIWQPGQHRGAQLVNEPGAFCWNELNTRDPDRAKAFYAAVFGWEADTQSMGEGGPSYTEFKVGGRSVAGMMDMRGRLPDEAPPHWLVYFAVDDTDQTVATATQQGGMTFMPPMDLPVGRFAVLGDPEGAVFAVIKMQPAE
ncbi:MAG TPA: VOC family protein [Acidimicrobiales bacterium]|nr:VOC family protein [Acidimicrobiales bacterium]